MFLPLEELIVSGWKIIGLDGGLSSQPCSITAGHII
jgi:hypothetical protein